MNGSFFFFVLPSVVRCLVLRIGDGLQPGHNSLFRVGQNVHLRKATLFSGAVPVFYVGWAFHYVTLFHGLPPPAFHLVIPLPIDDNKNLSTRMHVPV